MTEHGTRITDYGKRKTGQTWDPITSKVTITVVGFLQVTVALLAGELRGLLLLGVGRLGLRGTRAGGGGGVWWEDLVRFEVGKVLVAGAKRGIKRSGSGGSGRVVRGTCAGRSLRGVGGGGGVCGRAGRRRGGR